jgi:hypothetical protein
MASLLEPPLSSLDNTFIFKDASWLGRKHDGYSLLSFKVYIRMHPKISTFLGHELAICVGIQPIGSNDAS